MNTELLLKLSECTAACDICADACLDEDNLEKMISCIRTDRDCAAICTLTSAYVSRNSRYTEAALRLCIDVCRDCEAECKKHEAAHCQQCADSCRACIEACESHLSEVAA